MCGIAGFFDLRGRQSAQPMEETARAMSRVLAHRGPDDEGIWVDPSNGIALGSRRLAIQALSPAGHQPMLSVSGRYVLAFNGEIYNFAQLRDQVLYETNIAF